MKIPVKIGLLVLLLEITPCISLAQDFALAIYGGRLTKEKWDVLLRLHHRSDGFGTVADDGGSNALCAGFRFRF